MLVSGCAIDKGGLGADPSDDAAVVDADVDSATTTSRDTGQSVETSTGDAIPPGSDATDDASAVADTGSDAGDEGGADASDAGTNGPKCASVVLTPTAVVASTEMRPASYAIDSNFTTRWESAQNTLPQWIYLDFGAPVFIDRVQIAWEKACAQSYDLQVSNDAATWTTMESIVGNTLGGPSPADWTTAADHTGVTGVGRYMRVNATVRCQTYGYSLWEMRVFGDTSASCTP
jgi:hypothetical protein